MNKLNPFVVIPISLIGIILIANTAFELLSAKSNSKVFAGILLTIILLFILYKFVKYILNKSI